MDLEQLKNIVEFAFLLVAGTYALVMAVLRAVFWVQGLKRRGDERGDFTSDEVTHGMVTDSTTSAIRVLERKFDAHAELDRQQFLAIASQLGQINGKLDIVIKNGHDNEN